MLNPEKGDQNKSALPRLPSGRFWGRMDRRSARGVILNICTVFISLEGGRRGSGTTGREEAPSGIEEITQIAD